MGYPCTFFVPPRGEKRKSVITHINEEDEQWFLEHNAELSGEQLSTGQYCFYADVGIVDDGTPVEAIEIVDPDSDPLECFAKLRKQAEKLLEGQGNAK